MSAGKRPVEVVVIDLARDGPDSNGAAARGKRAAHTIDLVGGNGASARRKHAAHTMIDLASPGHVERLTSPRAARTVDLVDESQAGGSSPGAGSLRRARALKRALVWSRPSAAITCPICLCETEPGEAATLGACGHAFCTECLTQYVRQKVTAGEVLPEQLVCPCVEPNRCCATLLPRDVRLCLATPQDFERYTKLTLRRAVEVNGGKGDADDQLSCCPSADCSFMFSWGESDRKLDCPLCHKSFCLVCRCEPWHAGRRCEEVQAERGDGDAADRAFAGFAAREKLKQCPQCRFWVERRDGCDAMHCRCNFVFCYQCGGSLHGTGNSKQCTCGENTHELLRQHEGGPNHNLMPDSGDDGYDDDAEGGWLDDGGYEDESEDDDGWFEMMLADVYSRGLG